MLFANHYKKVYKSYISKLKISQGFKKILVDDEFISENPSLYLYYPKLFSDVFKTKKEMLDNLCIAGYLYYISVLNLDRLIDNNKKSSIPLISIAQEESIKLLTHIFGLDSEFWSFWDSRRSEYFKAVTVEKRLVIQNSISFKAYSNLADSKSAFGKVAIDALHHLSNKKHTVAYNKLIKSHKYFSIAYQINDDVLDFIDDFKNGQFNWAVQALKTNGESLEDIKTAKKIFYLNGYANKLFLKAIECLNKAVQILDGVHVPNWINEIKGLRHKFQTSIIETDNYIEVLTSEVYGSNTFTKNNTVIDSLKIGVEYIKSKQKGDGHWKEYVNQGGISDIWSTAFICSLISDSLFLKVSLVDNLKLGAYFLKRNKIDLLWGYNKTWIEDADTTNFVFITFLLNEVTIDPEAVRRWRGFKIKNGGFSTYKDSDCLLNSLDDNKISNVNGWLQTHQCVTAVAFYFMVLQRKTPFLVLELKCFFSKFLEQNSITAYWWTSNTYTYYFLAKSYFLLNEYDTVRAILNKVKEKLGTNGAIMDKYGENLFYSGMALEIFLLDPSNFHDEILSLIDFILKNQYEDGSWENSHALQIPDPSLLVPKSNNYPISTHGTSVRAKEYNRLFTTVSILKSLSEYEKKINGSTNF